MFPVIRAPNTAYSYNPKVDEHNVEEPLATGAQLSLVSTLQARNNARVTVLGSVEMLENAWFDAQVRKFIGEDGKAKGSKKQPVVNRAFAKEISAWTFQEIGVLKAGSIRHHQNFGQKMVDNETSEQTTGNTAGIYRVKSSVVSG